jgi:thiosulfate/3-mercaptopyruvate sulfurtransferase
LEPWEKVLVDFQAFGETTHGEIACVDCHNGIDAPDKEEAHAGLVARPSEGSAPACADCHEEQTTTVGNSLHATQEGYWTVLEARGADRNHPGMQEMFGNHCASCHASCGDCHVSQPASVGGGLLKGHVFTDQPPMTRTCTACHGSRVGNEYMGKNEGVMADVHFRQGRMTCTDCHEGEQMHGAPLDEADMETAPPPHRYAGAQTPSCESCHDMEEDATSDIREHRLHDDVVSCQVCHSTTYINCDSCHVQVSEESNTPYFTTEATYFTFLIGKNSRQDEHRPYDYVPVRHVPVDPESFAFYGENLMPDFDNEPTWRYATPHNIQRNTPQTESCNHCHGNAEIFLTSDKVTPEEWAANQGVIVDEIPEARRR